MIIKLFKDQTEPSTLAAGCNVKGAALVTGVLPSYHHHFERLILILRLKFFFTD